MRFESIVPCSEGGDSITEEEVGTDGSWKEDSTNNSHVGGDEGNHMVSKVEGEGSSIWVSSGTIVGLGGDVVVVEEWEELIDGLNHAIGGDPSAGADSNGGEEHLVGEELGESTVLLLVLNVFPHKVSTNNVSGDGHDAWENEAEHEGNELVESHPVSESGFVDIGVVSSSGGVVYLVDGSIGEDSSGQLNHQDLDSDGAISVEGWGVFLGLDILGSDVEKKHTSSNTNNTCERCRSLELGIN